MAEGIKLATAYVQIVASAKGVRGDVAKELRGVASDADKTGRKTGENLSEGITDGTDSKSYRKKLFGGLEREGESLGKRIGGKLGSGLKTLAKGGALAAGAAIGGSLVAGMGRLTAIDDAEGKLRGLGHSTKTVDGIMKNALGSVKGTAFGLDEAASTAAGTVAAGIKPGKELESTLALVADAATIAGTDMGSMGGIFNKVAATGKIQGDVLAQLGDQGIPILQFLSKELGVSSAEVSKLASEGKIDFETFRSAMETGLGGAAQKSGDTFSGAMKNTGAAAGRLGASLLSGLFPQMKGGFGNVTAALDNLGPAAEAMGKKVGAGVSKAASFVGDFVSDFKAGEGAAGRLRDVLSTMWGGISGGVKAAAGFIGDFVSNFKAGEGAAGRLREGLAKLWDGLKGAATTAFEALAPHVKTFGSAMADLAPFAADLAKSVGGFLKATFKAILPYLKIAGVVIGVVIVAAMKLLPPILKLVMIALGWVLDAVKPLLPAIIALLNPLAAIPVLLVRLWKSSGDLREKMKKIWASIKGAVSAVVAWFRDVAWPIMKKAFDWIAGKAKWLWGSVIKPYFGFILGLYKKVFSWLRDTGWAIVKRVFDAIGAIVKWLWNKAVKPYFGFIWGIAKKVFGWIKDTGWPKIRSAFNWIADKAKWLWGKVKVPFDKLKDGAQSLRDKVGWLRDWIKRYFQAVKANADWLWDKVKLAFNKLKDGVNAVKDAFGRAKDGIGKAWDKIYGKITSPIKKALRWLNRNLIGKLNTLLRKIPGVDFRIKPISTEGFATGGYTGAGAKYAPAGIVHKDEFVLRKEATNKLRRTIGLGGLDYMNQTGRMPEMGGYASGGIVALGKRLQDMGYDVSEHPAFGGVAPGAHSANGYHYKGGALDINADFWNSRFRNEMQALDRLNAMLRGEGWNTIWRAPNHWDHLHVDIGNGQGSGGGFAGWMKKFLPGWATSLIDSPLGFIKGKASDLMGNMPGGGKFGLAGKVLPGVVGKMASGIGRKVKDTFSMSKLLDKFLPDWLSGGDKGGGGGGSQATRAAVRAVASQHGWGSGAQWNAIDWIVNRESSWDPNAANPTSSARGLFQKMTSIHGPLEPTVKGQAEWAMRYFGRRYGSPLGAKAFWERNNWYGKGGLVKYAGVFDNGGTLAPGYNLVNNQLGKPEQLVRPEHAMAGGATFILKDSDGVLLGVIRGEIDANDDFKASVGRMGHG